MTKVTVMKEFIGSAEQIWNVVSGFNALPAWHPAVERSEIGEGGTVRNLTLLDGATILEKLEHHSDEMREYSYSIVTSPLPVTNYMATLKVSEHPEGSRVEWSSEFDPSGVSEGEAVELVQGVYQVGLDYLEKIVAHEGTE